MTMKYLIKRYGEGPANYIKGYSDWIRTKLDAECDTPDQIYEEALKALNRIGDLYNYKYYRYIDDSLRHAMMLCMIHSAHHKLKRYKDRAAMLDNVKDVFEDLIDAMVDIA